MHVMWNEHSFTVKIESNGWKRLTNYMYYVCMQKQLAISNEWSQLAIAIIYSLHTMLIEYTCTYREKEKKDLIYACTCTSQFDQSMQI